MPRLLQFIRSLITGRTSRLLKAICGTAHYLSYTLEPHRDPKPYLPHPIHRLPPELLSEIIYQSTPPRYGGIRERRKILALSHVCRHWRSVALSTPSLWTFIYLQCMESTFDRELDCARAWLSRSRQLPISVILEMMDVVAPSVEAAFRVLTPHCARWREFSLPVRFLGLHILSSVRGNLPLLESAEFSVSISHELSDAFVIAPRLRRLRLHLRDPLRSLVLVKNVPWMQLTHVELDTYITPAVHDIIASASNVVCLRVYLRDHVRGAEPQTITHPNISTLDVGGHDDDNAASCLMDHLVLPALRRLVLSQPWKCAIFLVARSACTLSSLKIPMFNGCDFVALLKLSPALQDLAITLVSADEWAVVVDALTFQGGMQLVPKLRSLDIRCVLKSNAGTSTDMTPFADMVASRWKPEDVAPELDPLVRSTLNHVKVVIWVWKNLHFPVTARTRLRQFVAEGLPLSLLAGYTLRGLL
ncbi:hypothetical protein FIBSPDRAFT_1045881 [Athelia psychrophila]|uniref:F-box domain-containing protein n=1 Tax=Athelia psychrophila TaxID=1759441 RepID=A0A166HK72_9AGAM|nr:hypothetical protein FIBSPDRAFT_1045881 [Fibularhizoctonia sp. CBS 109695]